MAGWPQAGVSQALKDIKRLRQMCEQDKDDAATACDQGWNGFVPLYLTVSHYASSNVCAFTTKQQRTFQYLHITCAVLQCISLSFSSSQASDFYVLLRRRVSAINAGVYCMPCCAMQGIPSMPCCALNLPVGMLHIDRDICLTSPPVEAAVSTIIL